jgi:hypothetical protein
MLVQPLRTATEYKVDRARKRATSGSRAQTLDTDFNNRGSTNAPDTTLLTLPSSYKACSAFARVAACTRARSPIRDPLSEGFSHFVTSMTAPIASGRSGCRGGACTHWKAPPYHGAHPDRTLADGFKTAACASCMAASRSRSPAATSWLESKQRSSAGVYRHPSRPRS